jgi:ATP adenylyltransferase/5',5'''-P-1,P-4-tetraphosphate phosphorylase II
LSASVEVKQVFMLLEEIFIFVLPLFQFIGQGVNDPSVLLLGHLKLVAFNIVHVLKIVVVLGELVDRLGLSLNFVLYQVLVSLEQLLVFLDDGAVLRSCLDHSHLSWRQYAIWREYSSQELFIL